MNINVWNLSQTRTHFFIRQRKQAQRKHLQKLKNAKSSIQIIKFTQTSKTFYPIATGSRIVDRQCQQKENNSLQHGPVEDTMISSIVRKVKFPHNNSSYIENLRVSSSLSRLRQTRQIQKENEKLITRLIKTKPSISEMQFKKNHLNHQKYRQNILKNKYLNPDYTKQVKTQTKSFSHLLLKPINNLAKIKETKPFASRIKEDPKSDNHRFTKLTNYRFVVKENQV